MKALNRYLDHAVLKPDLSPEEAENAIRMGLQFDTRTVCVRPCDIERATRLCSGSTTDVCAVLGFPHGCGLSHCKAQEAAKYVDLGVDEIDMVANYGNFRGNEWTAFRNDVESVFAVVRPNGILLKVILETALLELEQISEATRVCAEIGVDFVKSSTGFNGGGATIAAIETMVQAADGKTKVKASGGIRNVEQAIRFIEMGCERLGVGFNTTPVLCGNGAHLIDSDY